MGLGRVDFLNDTFEGFSLEVFGDLFFIGIFRKESIGPFDFLFLRPDSDFGHSGLLFSIFVVIDVIALNVLSSQFGIAFLEQLNADIFSFIHHVSELSLSDFLFDNERKLLA